MTQIAILGTGIMGAPMARNLLAAGFEVRAWNRTIEKARPLADDGATVAESPEEAASGADILLTMLADAEAVAVAPDREAGAQAALPEGGGDGERGGEGEGGDDEGDVAHDRASEAAAGR